MLVNVHAVLNTLKPPRFNQKFIKIPVQKVDFRGRPLKLTAGASGFIAYYKNNFAPVYDDIRMLVNINVIITIEYHESVRFR